MTSFERLRAVAAVLRENFATFIAGSLAYNAFMSAIPLLTLVLVAAAVLGDQRLVDQALNLTEIYLTPSVTNVFGDALRSSGGRFSVSVISFLLLVWSSLRVFRGLSASFAMLYATEDSTSVLEGVRDGLIVLPALGVALVASVAISAASTVVPLPSVVRQLVPFVLILPLFVAFLPIYYVFPDVDVTLREILPGVVVAAVGWAVLQVLFQVYVTQFSRYEIYGTIGAVLLVLTWLYIASFLLLVGVAVNVVFSGRTRRALEQTPGASG